MNLIPHDLKTASYHDGFRRYVIDKYGSIILFGRDGISYRSFIVYIGSQAALYHINAGAYEGVHDYVCYAHDLEMRLGPVRVEERLSTVWMMAHVAYELEY